MFPNIRAIETTIGGLGCRFVRFGILNVYTVGYNNYDKWYFAENLYLMKTIEFTYPFLKNEHKVRGKKCFCLHPHKHATGQNCRITRTICTRVTMSAKKFTSRDGMGGGVGSITKGACTGRPRYRVAVVGAD